MAHVGDVEGLVAGEVGANGIAVFGLEEGGYLGCLLGVVIVVV